MRLLEYVDNFYDLAYYYYVFRDKNLEESRSTALYHIIQYGDNDEKLKFLGEDRYLDYLIAKKRMDDGKYDYFIDVLDDLYPEFSSYPEFKKKRIIEHSLEDNVGPMFISEKIKEAFSLKGMESYFESKKIL